VEELTLDPSDVLPKYLKGVRFYKGDGVESSSGAFHIHSSGPWLAMEEGAAEPLRVGEFEDLRAIVKRRNVVLRTEREVREFLQAIAEMELIFGSDDDLILDKIQTHDRIHYLARIAFKRIKCIRGRPPYFYLELDSASGRLVDLVGGSKWYGDMRVGPFGQKTP
jgi:hypothetical protein